MIVEVILFLILFVVIYTLYNQDPPGYPPGPFRIPIIGGGRPNSVERTVRLQKKYGDLILEKIGNAYWLIICDYKLTKEALSKTELSNRPHLAFIKEISGGKINGISTTNGEHWKSNRRFVLHYLRDSGMGKSSLEHSIKREAEEIVAEFGRLAGSTTSLTFLNFASLNVIWQMVAGQRYDVNDPMLDKVQKLSHEFFESFRPIVAFELVPILKYLIPQFIARHIFRHKKFVAFFDHLASITQPLIDEHRKNLDRDNPKDMIDMYLMEEENPKQLIAEHISDKDLRALTNDLFNAGSDTVSLSLRWAILYLAKNPLAQTKMQEEIDSIVPRDTLPGYEHKSRLPYCEAVIHEVLRKSSLNSFGGVRCNTEDIQLGGYTIPKNSFIVTASQLIHHNPKYWKNPEEFNPSRFIDEDGKFLCPKEGFLPFGIGKRQCPGEGLARVEMYVFLTAIIQNFSFSAPDGKTFDDSSMLNSAIFHLPKPQEYVVRARN